MQEGPPVPKPQNPSILGVAGGCQRNPKRPSEVHHPPVRCSHARCSTKDVARFVSILCVLPHGSENSLVCRVYCLVSFCCCVVLFCVALFPFCLLLFLALRGFVSCFVSFCFLFCFVLFAVLFCVLHCKDSRVPHLSL